SHSSDLDHAESEHHHTHSGDHHHHHDHHDHCTLKDIEKIIQASEIDSKAKEMAMDIFRYVARAEGKIHGMPMEEVHFHEVGAVDSIVDIVGTAILLRQMGIERVLSSPLHLGTGFMRCAHGTFPVPAPATLAIMEEAKIPAYSRGIRCELVTPTGAAIVAGVVDQFGPMEDFVIEKIGYGAGSSDIEIPNVLRLLLVRDAFPVKKNILKIEANIDDMTGEELSFAMEKLFEAGAVDVTMTPTYMKKNRPAHVVTVLCPMDKKDFLIEAMLRNTSTIGLRMTKMERVEMEREETMEETPLGKLRIKRSRYGDILKEKAEFEDLKRSL
ncbi:MAG: nickel pincer cofactor biosynthesis protein LarC, partial [Tissierellia bacterium]|nr:nickel pincer cofactor biosynthesis protein LarC [Tissierellia bacterium]